MYSLEKIQSVNSSRPGRPMRRFRVLVCGGLILTLLAAGILCWRVVRSDRRDVIRTALLREQIECGIHYPVPLHLQPACRDLGYTHGNFPHAEAMADSVLSLPMHPFLTEREVMTVSQVVKHALATG